MSKNHFFEAPKPLKKTKNKLVILQPQASKKVKGSKNQRQAYNKITRIYSRISGIRKELLHKLKSPTLKSLKLIKMGDLNVKGLMLIINFALLYLTCALMNSGVNLNISARFMQRV